jgi:hypothetical protein
MHSQRTEGWESTMRTRISSAVISGGQHVQIQCSTTPRGEVDMAIAMITVTRSRSTATPHLYPYHETAYRIVTLRPGLLYQDAQSNMVVGGPIGRW